jgi:membrane-associated protease RseP (regulator of RpoE activity)
MVIDNGAADTVNLARPFVMANDLLTRARKTPATAPNTMAGSEKEFFAQTSVRGRLSSLALGPYRLTDIPGNLMVGKTGGYASTEFSATIGEGILKRFDAVYDYSRFVIHLEPNADYGKPFPGRRTFGATFLSDGPDYRTFKVTGIRKESPAEAAGLMKDDLLTAMDGKPASDLRLADLRAALAAEGSKHTLTIQRGGKTITIDLVVTLISLDEV